MHTPALTVPAQQHLARGLNRWWPSVGATSIESLTLPSCASLCFWCLRQQGPHPAMPFRQILGNWQSGSQHSHPIPHTSNSIPDSDTSPDTISDSRMSFYDFTAQHLIHSASFICFHWAHVFSGIYLFPLCRQKAGTSLASQFPKHILSI